MKVGDRVKLIRPSIYDDEKGLNLGALGRIAFIEEDKVFPLVIKFDNGVSQPMAEDQLEVVKETAGTENTILTHFYLNDQKSVFVDCDDTLILWDVSAYVFAPKVSIEYAGHKSELAIHQKNVNLVRKMAKLGHPIVVWSATGADWAKKVAEAVGLDDIVVGYLTKPKYIIDDLDAANWTTRIWRHPLTGESE
jgi:hypothetical protein